MPTEAQLVAALTKADAAGDTASAQQFAGMIKQARQSRAPATAAQPDEDRSLIGAVREGVASIPASAAKFAGDLYTAASHPLDTATALSNTGQGVADYITRAAPDFMRYGDTDARARTPEMSYADRVGQLYKDRYGGWTNIKNTVATDPVGFLSDASIPISAGVSVAGKLPAFAKSANAASEAARAVNPVRAVTSATRAAVTKVLPDVIGNLGTGTGGESLRVAAKAGMDGGDKADAFLSHMRGQAPVDEVVGDAHNALTQLRAQRSEAYRNGMADVSKDKTVLSFKPVDQAIASGRKVKNFQGMDLSPSTANIRNDITQTIDEWRGLDPSTYHTPEGFDALKQKIGDIRDSTAFGTPERVVADQAYHSIRNAIVQQAPGYGKVMKDYEAASEQLRDIQKTLSLNPGASIDTKVRKLQSALRNNVNTGYGRRAEIVGNLADNGAPTLREKLAGQSLSSFAPRGLGTVDASMAALASLHNPLAAAALPFASPRLMGEGAYYAGKIAGYAKRGAGAAAAAEDAAPATAQVGRVQNDNAIRSITSPPRVVRPAESYGDKIVQLHRHRKAQ